MSPPAAMSASEICPPDSTEQNQAQCVGGAFGVRKNNIAASVWVKEGRDTAEIFDSGHNVKR